MPLNGPQEFADWMRRRGFTQADAARYLEVAESFISRLLAGLDRPGLNRALKIERLTGIPIEVWASEEEDEATVIGAVAAKRRLAK